MHMFSTLDTHESPRTDVGASPQKPRIMLCRKHPNNRDKALLQATAEQDQLLLRASVLSPKGPGLQLTEQLSGLPRQPLGDGMVPMRRKAGEYISLEGFGSSQPNEHRRPADGRNNFFTQTPDNNPPTAGYLSVANEADRTGGLQLGESTISLRKKAAINDNSIIGRHRRANPTEQPFDAASNRRKPRPSSCGLALANSRIEVERETDTQTRWTPVEQPAPSLTLSSVYNSARKPADPAKSINLKSSQQSNLMLDSMTSSAIKKNLSLRSTTKEDKQAELLEKIRQSTQDIESLDRKIAKAKAELRELVPNPSLQTLASLQSQSQDLQKDIHLLTQATEITQAENQENMSKLKRNYEERMQSANARTGDLSDCEDRLRENRLLKQRLRQRKAEFEGRLQQKVESMREKSRQQLELEEEYLFFKYETDPDATKHDLLAYHSFLRDRHAQLLAGLDHHSASEQYRSL